MCELLGMSANVPTDICFSFSGLVERGGRTGPHSDGWGIGFYEGKACRIFRDPSPSVDSEVARLVKNYPIKSTIVISHIRQANRGRVGLENTHPFERELWGRTWVMAHNGQMKGIKKKPLGAFNPIGTTDSEHAFCYLLERVRAELKKNASPERLGRFLKKIGNELSELGVCNFLLSDGRVMYAHCHNHLHWITRRAPFGKASLTDTELQVNFAEVTTENDVVTVVATQPLTDNETWNKIKPGQLLMFKEGEVTEL